MNGDSGKLTLDLMTRRCIYFGAVALTLYDCLILLGDEVRYVWKGRKSWIFYLYITNRILLIAYQLWHICFDMRNALDSESELLSYGAYGWAERFILAFFLLSSDIFVTLRTYAITSKNKALTASLVILGLARFITSSLWFWGSITLAMTISLSVGTTFEITAFAIIVWYSYRNKGMLKCATLVRTLATQGAIYFVAIIVWQIYIEVALLSFADESTFVPLVLALCGLFHPLLTLRFVLALKRSADPEGGQKWHVMHFTTIEFAEGHPRDTRDSVAHEITEVGPDDISRRPIKIRGLQRSMMESASGNV